MISQFLLLLFITNIALISTIATVVNAAAQAQAQVSAEAETYDKFDGTISDSSSWFDPSRWTDILKLPTSIDTVWIDESNTYVAIDSIQETAEVEELIIGRSGSSNSMESVQIDLLNGATLNVATNMIIGQFLESDGTVFASHNTQITIGETLTIGSEGSGIVILTGNAQIHANDINICDQISSSGVGGCKLIMDDDSTLHINGDKRNKLNQMIEYGLIVFSSSSSSSQQQQGQQEEEDEDENNKVFHVTTKSNDGGTTITTTVQIITDGLPTDAPTIVSTEPPTKAPTEAPTKTPTKAPVLPTDAPTTFISVSTEPPTTAPTKAPAEAPFLPTDAPTSFNFVSTEPPTKAPTKAPEPTDAPTTFNFVSTEPPTKAPTKAPKEASCKDKGKFKFKGKKKKNCLWAARKNKCHKKYKRKSIKNHWCREACGKCSPPLDPTDINFSRRRTTRMLRTNKVSNYIYYKLKIV